jgi:alpha-tubulin suppressor-like RCC1 family protein
MSSLLWRYYLSSDAERFRLLLQSSQPHAPTLPSSPRRSVPSISRDGGPLAPAHNETLESTIGHTSSKNKSARNPLSTDVVLTKKILRELDCMGRSILHLACTTSGQLPFVTALLWHPLTDPSLPDLESGWSPLHRALYNGNISAAREILSVNKKNNLNLVKLKDHAGETPFEVFDDSMGGIPFEKLQQGEGDELFTWGSNKNLSLGFSDGDDRTYPEKVNLRRPHQLLIELAEEKYSHLPNYNGKSPEELLDASIYFEPVHIEDIHLSKFHTAILTTDLHSNLFLCGFGRGGRLGFGDKQSTQFTFRPLTPPLLPKMRVEKVSLGLDHTVVILEDGGVWTWGTNQWGQLGYVLQPRICKEEPIQTTPRQVLGILKKLPIYGCAASRIHTCVFNFHSLYTFGKNEGQLGIFDSSEAQSAETQPLPRKVPLNFLNDNHIEDVVAIEKATAILLATKEIWVLAGHLYSKISFPIEQFSNGISLHPLSRKKKSNFVRKIAAGGQTICALSENGGVFVVDVEATLKERHTRDSWKVVWNPQQVWSVRKRHMVVRDVSVSMDNNIIICTQSGGVWSRSKRRIVNKSREVCGNAREFKFDRVPGLTKIVAVRSNATGAFAAIKKDSDLMRKELKVRTTGLWNNVESMLSLTGIFENDKIKSSRQVADYNFETRNYGWAPQVFAPNYTPLQEKYGAPFKWFSEGNTQEDLQNHLDDLRSSGRMEQWDAIMSSTKFPNINIPVHSIILGRSPVLRKLVKRRSGTIGDLTVELSGEGKIKVLLQDVQILTLVNLIHYLYTDRFVDVWNSRDLNKHQRVIFKKLEHELLNIASTMELNRLEEALNRLHYPKLSLDQEFEAAYQDHEFISQTADMVIDVADDECIPVHSALMRTRSPFFETLCCGQVGGMWLLGRKNEGQIHVDMKHVPKDIMKMIVSWIYSDWGVNGFEGIRVGIDEGNLDCYLNFVIDVLSVANELILLRLIEVCQREIGLYVNTRNVAGLLSSVAPCSEEGFKKKCFQYISENVESMLQNQCVFP